VARVRNWSRRKMLSRVIRIMRRTARPLLVTRLLEIFARLRAAELTDSVVKTVGLTVHDGPFRGMTLPERPSWGEGDLLPKIAGCYEAELHPALRKALGRAPGIVVNVGCAEGYYAVGLALALPQAQVFAYDIRELAQEVCAEAARDNGVAGRVTIAGACSSEILRGLMARGGRALVVMDCEGAEIELLDDGAVAAMGGCDLIVECHDSIRDGITETLRRRLAGSHTVEIIGEIGREPLKIPALADLSDLDRSVAVCEFRSAKMNWLAAWAAR